MEIAKPTVEELVELLELERIPAEGGWFRRTHAGEPDSTGRPASSAIICLFSPEDFSAMHRLPTTEETWHFHFGDPLRIVLLDPEGSARVEVLGHDVAAGQRLQLTVPAGTWMGAQVVPGGQWAVCGTTCVPGFVAEDYEGGDVEDLTRRYPAVADLIRQLCRAGAPLRMTAGSEGNSSHG